MPNATKQKEPLKRSATFDHLRSKKKRVRKVVEVLLDDVTEPGTDASEEVWDEYRRQIADNTVTMTFESLPRRDYDALLDAHPASEEQKKKAKKEASEEPVWNAETFVPALIAASCIEPKMTPGEVTELIDEWNQAEIMDLFMAALLVNTQKRIPALGKGYGPTRP